MEGWIDGWTGGTDGQINGPVERWTDRGVDRWEASALESFASELVGSALLQGCPVDSSQGPQLCTPHLCFRDHVCFSCGWCEEMEAPPSPPPRG